MLEYFSNLNEDEKVQLMDSLPLITVLIAGADGNFEKEEMDWAEKIAHIRSYKLKNEIKAFYQEVDTNFMEKVQYFMDSMPSDTNERQALITERLTSLNAVLAKLDPAIGSKLYKGFVSFAKHVANASGGIAGFFTINLAESKLIGLPMLTPIISLEGEEE